MLLSNYIKNWKRKYTKFFFSAIAQLVTPGKIVKLILDLLADQTLVLIQVDALKTPKEIICAIAHQDIPAYIVKPR